MTDGAASGPLRSWLRARSAQYALLIVGLAAVAPYALSVTFGFVYDDRHVVEGNPALHGAHGLFAAWQSPYWPPALGTGVRSPGLFRPLTQFLFAVLWNVGGGRPQPFHVWNVLLHVAVTIGLCALLMRALPPWIAAAGALLFAVHPVHVEAVASIVGGAEVLVGVFAIALSAMLMHAGVRAGDEADIGWGWACAIGTTYLAALGAKESAALLPAVALAMWWGWRGDDMPSLASLLRRGRRVWYACAAALVLFLVWRESVLGRLAVGEGAVAYGMRGMNASSRLATMLGAWPIVARLLIWPTKLMMHYGPSAIVPRHSPSAAGLVALGAALAMAGAALLLARRGDRRAPVALAWIALTYLPAANLILPTGQLLAERTLYVPSMGAIMLLAWGAAMIVGAFDARARLSAGIRQTIGAVAVVALLAIAGGASSAVWNAALNWQSEYTLFVSGISADPRASRPYQLLAEWYLREGKRERAAAMFARAHELEPGNTDVSVAFAKTLVALHRVPQAFALLDSAHRAEPGAPIVVAPYISALMDVRGPDAVISAIHDSVTANALGRTRFLFLASAFTKKGEGDSVIATYRAATVANPLDATLHFLLAQALFESRQPEDASLELRIAESIGTLPLAPRSVLAARIALSLGDSAAARIAIATAAAANPGDTVIARLAASIARRP